MTIIVAYKDRSGVIMASDSATSFGNHVMQNASPKIHFLNPGYDNRRRMLVGCSGPSKFQQILKFDTLFNPSAGQPHVSDYEWLCTDFTNALASALKSQDQLRTENGIMNVDAECLIAIGDELYYMASDLTIISPPTPFYAAGSGYQYALGYLELANHLDLLKENTYQCLRDAVKVACKYDRSCYAPVRMTKLHKDKSITFVDDAAYDQPEPIWNILKEKP